MLVVADPGRTSELAAALAEPLPSGPVDVLVSSGGDDTIDLFDSRAPRVVVLTATLEQGDAKSLIETLRDMVPREELIIVLVGDDIGPVRNALDAIDMKPDRFVSRPLSVKALRFAVQSGLESVARAVSRSEADDELRTTQPISARPVISVIPDTPEEQAVALARTQTPVRGSGRQDVTGPHAPSGQSGPTVARAPTDRGLGGVMLPPAEPVDARNGKVGTTLPGVGNGPRPASNTSPPPSELRARWSALADEIGEGDDEDLLSEDDLEMLEDHAPPLPPIEIAPRKKGITNPEFMAVPPLAPWRPGSTEIRDHEVTSPTREPTLIINDPPPASSVPPPAPPPAHDPSTLIGRPLGMLGLPLRPPASPSSPPPLGAPPSMPGMSSPQPGQTGTSQTQTTQTTQTAQRDNSPRERWSHPVLLSELIDKTRDSSRELLANVKQDFGKPHEVDDGIIVGHPVSTPPPHVLRGGSLQQLEDLMEPEVPPDLAEAAGPPPSASPAPADLAPPERIGGRDFARQLRAKMSQMAQRLFQSESPAQPSVDIRPRHDHHTEIDLAGLGDEPVLGGGVTEIESRGRSNPEPREVTTSPGSWDTQVRERGLPAQGEIVRGVSDTPTVLARMFQQQFTGRVGFRRDDVEKVVYFDQGRPVFASSNEPGDRMGQLLVREGKITAAQYERCQVHVAQSGRRMGEILVDFGYLKRRELLPAVRRHVEDIVYSLFGWDYGIYHLAPEQTASAERIRLSRHPASLVLEGIRRKLDRTTLEKLCGPPSTIIEIPQRERLNTVLNAGDLTNEERAALTAFDGQADLGQVARVTGLDVADVLPLAWGLVVLGLATARRTEVDNLEESTALVGETDLAIDRERVRARWQLVTEADYFALLGVRRDATAFEIRRAYQSARRDFAADCFPQDLRRELARELEEIADVLDEAFRVLRDDRLRGSYLENLIG